MELEAIFRGRVEKGVRLVLKSSHEKFVKFSAEVWEVLWRSWKNGRVRLAILSCLWRGGVLIEVSAGRYCCVDFLNTSHGMMPSHFLCG